MFAGGVSSPGSATKASLQDAFNRTCTRGRTYIRAFFDSMIADQLETSRDREGLSWLEALDEASCYYRGTQLAGTPDAMKKAWNRARKRSRAGWFQRDLTRWESRALIPAVDPVRLRPRQDVESDDSQRRAEFLKVEVTPDARVGAFIAAYERVLTHAAPPSRSARHR